MFSLYLVCSLSTCAPDGHVLRVTIPDAASIQFKHLMMSILYSERVEDYNKSILKKAIVYQDGHCLRLY